MGEGAAKHRREGKIIEAREKTRGSCVVATSGERYEEDKGNSCGGVWYITTARPRNNKQRRESVCNFLAHSQSTSPVVVRPLPISHHSLFFPFVTPSPRKRDTSSPFPKTSPT